jgi:4-carboxymuconolactone decarboxylase
MGALRNGCTPDEIAEVLLQAAVYAGIPAGVDAFKVAERAIEEYEASAEGGSVRASDA